MLAIYVLIFGFGASLGSFYHVIGYRLPQKMDWVNERSACPHCQEQLRWFELFPILSYLWQKGRCRHCQVAIKPIYIWAEIISGSLFLLPVLHFGVSQPLNILFAWLFFSVLAVVTVSDLYFSIIPNSVLLTFLPLLAFYPNRSWAGMFLGFFVLYANRLLGRWIFGKETLGGGDVKLYGLVGLMLGNMSTVLSLIIASVLGIIFAWIKSEKKAFPFGPFIAIASYFCFFYGDSLLIWLKIV